MKYLWALWSGWKAFAHRLGIVQTAIMMTIFYFLVLGIASIFTLVLRKDLLRTRRSPGSQYVPHVASPDTVERYEHLS